MKNQKVLLLSAITLALAGALAGCVIQIEDPVITVHRPVIVWRPGVVIASPGMVVTADMVDVEEPEGVIEEGTVVEGQVIVAPVDVEECDWVLVDGIGWHYWHPGFHRWVYDRHREYGWHPLGGHYYHGWDDPRRPREHADGRGGMIGERMHTVRRAHDEHHPPAPQKGEVGRDPRNTVERPGAKQGPAVAPKPGQQTKPAPAKPAPAKPTPAKPEPKKKDSKDDAK